MILWAWFILWALHNCPHINTWNGWSISLIIAVILSWLLSD